MDTSRKFLNLWRWTALAVTTLLALSFLALAANAGHQTGAVVSMTGCLNTTKGTFSNVALGDAPKAACGANEQVVHLSGGDITGVTAGQGLSGGSASGNANLSVNSPDCTEPIGPGIETDLVSQWTGTGWSCVDRTYHAGEPLTQVGETFLLSNTGCATGELWKWTGSRWSCDPDIDTRYFAGNALTLGPTNAFALRPCNPNQILRNGGSGFGQAWDCANERVGGYETVTRSSASNSDDTKFVDVPCPSGKTAIGGGMRNSAFARIPMTQSYPLPMAPGAPSVWRVQAAEQDAIWQSWQIHGYAICAYV